MGCDKLIQHLEGRLGVEIGNTTPDEAFTFLPVYCLGNCALSPAAMLDGESYGRLSPEIADSLINDARRRD
jgi:formate dehydrogenase subunit gamma